MSKKYRDSQRSKFYNWTHLLSYGDRVKAPPIPYTEFIDEVQRYLDMYGVTMTVLVDTGKSLSANFNVAKQCIHLKLPLFNNFKVESLATIVGWSVYYHRRQTLTEGFHGPTFCKVWAQVYSDKTNQSEVEIVESMRNHSLKVKNFVLKSDNDCTKHDNLLNRVTELEDAIARGRAEFEEFLQPILLELSNAKTALENFEAGV